MSAERKVLETLSNLQAYQALLESLRNKEHKSSERRGLGLPRTARLALFARLQLDLQVPMLLLTNRADRALALYDELSFWLPQGHHYYFPDPNPLFYENLAWSERTRLDRLHVLSELALPQMPGMASEKPKIDTIIAPIRALMTRTIPRRDFLKATQRIKIGEKRDLTQTLEKLVGIGYEYSNIVVQPGQFARRGGLIDVWSPASALPIRFEFFGDEIDTIKSFDPATQRSLESLQSSHIFPASEALPEKASAEINLETEKPTGTFEASIASLYRFHSNLFDYLPANALILLDGEEFIAATALDIEEESINRRNDLIKNGELPSDYPVPYFTWSELNDGINQLQVLELGHSHALGGSPLSALFDPGPRFAGRLKDFQAHLKQLERTKQSWTVVSRQAARLKQLWSETLDPEKGQESLDNFTEASLSDGWVLHVSQKQKHHLLTDSEIFGWSRPQARRRPMLFAEAPEALYEDFKPGDYIVHVDYGIGQFIGLHRPKVEGVQREYLAIGYKDNDTLYVPIQQADRLTRYIGADSSKPTLQRLGGSDWMLTKSRVRTAVAEVASELLDLYARRETVQGYAFGPDSDWQRELEASFPYIETPDQLDAIQQVKNDMESTRPMDRLLCGDVGYGKTEVALRAAFKAVSDGKQVAILVPTTVLAQQHYDTFRDRLSVFPLNVEMLSRFRTPKEQDQIVKKLAEKKVDIVIGTHRLLSSDVQFADLGLVIIDEEQRFGVSHKEHLKKLRSEVDVLTLTATPIPRTLYMALSGVRDISTINSPPEERMPVLTHVGPYDPKLVREAIIRELDRGGQVFFVHNRVQSIEVIYNQLSALVPEARIGIGHGQMHENQLSKVMEDFTQGEIDVLLSTSIIESGLDIPNANTLIIDRADTFGLAQLYQLRGRVGRGAQRAYAYLFRDSRRMPTPEGEERLEILAENARLGAGYSIAMRDLEMRGAGDLLGTRQSGYISAVGFQLYTRLLSQAVRRLRQSADPNTLPKLPQLALSELPSLDINVELPLSAEIPPSYIPDQDLRLTLYRRISALRDEASIDQTEAEFADRFGALPKGVEDLLYQMRVKILGEARGLDSIGFSGQQMVLNYPPLPSGIKDRGLPELDPPTRAGRNAYWIKPESLESEDWQTLLLKVLRQIPLMDR